MNEVLPNFELLLREALAPVEPPADLVERVESALLTITEMAADELEAWELSAMRDPRNWVRPAAALVAGGAAGTALVLLRARRRSRGSQRTASSVRASAGPLAASLERSAERAIRDFAQQTRKLLDRS
jgi:hypothetical protein